MNSFGTGATSPFLKRTGDDELRPANRQEYEKIILAVGEQQDAVGIFSLPVACDKSISLFEIAQLMEKRYQGLKMITTNTMTAEELTFFQGKEDWIDGTSLVSPLLRVLMDGNVNLPKEVLDVRVEPKFVATLKGQGDEKQRSGLMVPVLITGTFASPKIRPDLKAMVNKQLSSPEGIMGVLGGKTGEEQGTEDGTGKVKPEDAAKSLLKGFLQ